MKLLLSVERQKKIASGNWSRYTLFPNFFVARLAIVDDGSVVREVLKDGHPSMKPFRGRVDFYVDLRLVVEAMTAGTHGIVGGITYNSLMLLTRFHASENALIVTIDIAIVIMHYFIICREFVFKVFNRFIIIFCQYSAKELVPAQGVFRQPPYRLVFPEKHALEREI